LIAHPGRQHSHQAALALHEANMLGCYASGVPVSPAQLGLGCEALLRKFSMYEDVAVPLGSTRLNMIAPIANRLLGRRLPETIFGPLAYCSNRLFDRWAAKLAAHDVFDAVIAYENSAYYTFRAAKKKNARCILDAASLHYAEQNRYNKRRITRRLK